VADEHRIQVFRPDGSFVRAWGSHGTADGQFTYPHILCVAPQSLYVSDLGGNLQSFEFDGRFRLRMHFPFYVLTIYRACLVFAHDGTEF
jgi:hypothetical protein